LFAIRNPPSRLKARVRIGGRVSSENPVLASADEARAPWRRKFFYCQSLRLRVRASVILTASASRDNIDRVSIVNCAI